MLLVGINDRLMHITTNNFFLEEEFVTKSHMILLGKFQFDPEDWMTFSVKDQKVQSGNLVLVS